MVFRSVKGFKGCNVVCGLAGTLAICLTSFCVGACQLPRPRWCSSGFIGGTTAARAPLLRVGLPFLHRCQDPACAQLAAGLAGIEQLLANTWLTATRFSRVCLEPLAAD